MAHSSPLYVKRLHLRNIRRFAELEVQFDRLGESILVIGDNGDGKSTVLRTLTMGLCDESSAAALFRELPGEFVRKRSIGRKGVITVDLGSGSAVNYQTQTTIIGSKTFERVEQKVFRVRGSRRTRLPQDTFPWDRIFVTGYGAGIRTLGTADFDYYLAADAVYPLFRYDTPLQNPELVMRRLISAAYRSGSPSKALRTIRRLLSRILQLRPKDRIELTSTGIVVVGPWGRSELSALGDGYRATVTWVLDLLSWWFIKQEQERTRHSRTDVKGIVLLDEAEQHLHPRWQRGIMRLLTESFPHVQFVATTHSPLVASGCEGIPVHHLRDGLHKVEHPFGWLAEDVYEMMGVPSTRAEPFRTEILERFRQLDTRRVNGQISSSELKELKRLKARLDQLPGTDSVRLFTELKNIRERAKSLALSAAERNA